MVDVEARQVLHRPQREGRPSELVRGVDLRDADLGDLDLEVAWDREIREPALTRVGTEQHDRVRSVRRLAAGPVAAVGAEHEDRRRGRDEEPVTLRQQPSDARGHPVVRLRDAARDGQVAPDAPGDEQNEEQHQAERDPTTDPAAFRRRRLGRGGRRRRSLLRAG